MTNQKLKNRLLLKRLTIQIEKEADLNLGYAPSNIWFDEMVDKRNIISTEVMKTDREWWDMFDHYKEGEDTKNLPIFLNYC